MALNLLKAAENTEHLKRHTDNGSLTVGSKALPGVDERQVTAMLKTFDNAYAELIAKEGNPGCRQFCLRCAAPVGTDAVIDKADLKKEAIPVFLPETKKNGFTDRIDRYRRSFQQFADHFVAREITTERSLIRS